MAKKGIKPKNWSSLYTPKINKKRGKTVKRLRVWEKTKFWEKAGIIKGRKLSENLKRKIGKGVKNSEKYRSALKNPERSKKMSEAFSGEKCHFWKGGISFEPYSLDWTRTLRRAIRERDNYICQLCSQYGNVVHHIDYDKKNCDPKNLVTLCRKCNPKVNSHREYWKCYFKNDQAPGVRRALSPYVKRSNNNQ